MLTKQEAKVADLISVGYSDKEAADLLCISTRTVVNHKQNIFQKLGINKSTELSAWYWCKKFNVKFDLKELKKQAITTILIFCLIPSVVEFDQSLRRSRTINRAYRLKTEYWNSNNS